MTFSKKKAEAMEARASEKKKTTVATLILAGVAIALIFLAHFMSGKLLNLRICSSLTLSVPTIGVAAAAVYAPKASVAYDPKAGALFDPKAAGAAHIAVRASVAFDPKTSDEFDPKTSDDFDPKTSDDFDPKTADDFEPKTSNGFGPKTSDGFDPKTSDGFDPKTSAVFDPKATDTAHIVARGLETSSTTSAPDVICYITGRATYPTPSAAFPTETLNGVISTSQGSVTPITSLST